jgi:hypothetical protein
MQIPEAILLDARTSEDVWDRAVAEMQSTKLVGIDCETQDENRHAGLNAYNNEKRHAFDHRRTIMTGFSLYAEGSDTAWYINLAHADVENRVPFDRGLELINAINPEAIKVAHNAPFEIVMFDQCHGVTFENLICTLQLAVTHHGPDEYDLETFQRAQLSGFARIAPAVRVAFANYAGGPLTSDQSEMLGKFTAKESKAEHSYNGFVKSIATGYSLKALTLSRFGVRQMTFKEVLAQAGAKHMGELTGDQVCQYGADDAFWAVEHYKWMRDDLLATNPAAFVTFLKTENPMVQVYADSWKGGLRLDMEQVYERQRLERIEMAAALREFKALLRGLLPFNVEPNAVLLEKQDKWYKNWATKRKQIETWAASADSDDDFTQCSQVSNPIGNAWAIEKGLKAGTGKLNLTYYQTLRTLVHDLLGHRLVYDKGEVSSDKEARGKMVDTFERENNQPALAAMKLLQTMADIEQRMKLYITSYIQLLDPETGRIYPTISSMLATRRMAMRDPNGMQLAKQGGSAYIRSFYLPDNDDSVIISADWSSIELVLIGDQSRDPEFAKVFGQLPYGDLHSGAAADCLAVKTLPGLTEAEFMEFKFGRNPNNRELKHVYTGEIISPTEYYKLTRGTAVGKGANFSYFYSGALSSVSETLGWTDTEMWDAVDRYRQRFAVAEAWRVGVGLEGVQNGFITLPDGHTRVRREATAFWHKEMVAKFMDLGADASMRSFAELALKRIQGRAKNQLVNATIQGTCATLAKRSILTINKALKGSGITRFLLPVHDELVYSVPKSEVMSFIPILRDGMCNHPDIVPTLPLSCSVAMGRTFRSYDKTNAAFSQIELDEVQPLPGVIPEDLSGQALNDNQVEEVLEYLFKAKAA